jgi:hypothetical protein
MTPSGPILLSPGRVLVGDGVSLSDACLPVDDSLAESSGAESVSDGDPGES